MLWLPFLLHAKWWFGLPFKGETFQTVYQHFDGLLYLVPAMSWYDPKEMAALRFEFSLPWEYYAAHLPMYPAFITLFSPILGNLKAMLFVSIAFSTLLAVFFYRFLEHFQLTKKPMMLLAVFLFLPRFLIVRSVGAPEGIFMLFVLVSIYFFEEKKYWIAGLAGMIAVMTKTPGMLLFFAYGLVFLERMIKEKRFNVNWLGIGLIPLGLALVFILYAVQYSNFWAYFNSGDNIHLVSPFAVFNHAKRWVGTAWLEEILFYFFMYGLTIITLKDSKHRSFFYFTLVFFTATLFIDHRDISRYSLPMWPFACIAFEKFFTSKKFWIIFLILLPGIYLYAVNFMLYNIHPISDWRPFL